MSYFNNIFKPNQTFRISSELKTTFAHYLTLTTVK